MPRPGQLIALCVLALLILGVVMVNSALMTVDRPEAGLLRSIVLGKPALFMTLALGAMCVCAHLPVRRLAALVGIGGPSASDGVTEGSGECPLRGVVGVARSWLGLWPLWLAVGVMLAMLLLVYAPVIGKQVNGSYRWITIPGTGIDSIQLSELAKWGLIPLLAWYCRRRRVEMPTFWRGLLPGLAAAGLPAAFIVVEDLGTGVLIGLVACVMLIAGGARTWHLVALSPLPVTAVAGAIAGSDYRRDRLLAFLDPYAQPEGIGYHMIQSMVAVANGEFFGRGLGHGLQKFGYLPEDHSDFLFAVICEELGVAGAAVVVCLYAALLWACWAVIRREREPFFRLFTLGVAATVALQALINLLVVTGLGPTKGIALPLLSSGGTGWILTAASLGVVIAIDRSFGLVVQGRRSAVPTDPTEPSPVVSPARAATTSDMTPEACPAGIVTPPADLAPIHAQAAMPGLPRVDHAIPAHTAVVGQGLLFGEDPAEAAAQAPALPVVIHQDARTWVSARGDDRSPGTADQLTPPGTPRHA